jgi:cyclomaltodextrinase / maltogenic alpha-amylase / neopullulanase
MNELPLGYYQHYKGNFYEVIGTARHHETLEELVIYKALYDSPEFGASAWWARPKKEFLEDIQIDGQHVPRFRYISKD